MDAKLLQKIEELTLYTIQQHKQIKSQQDLLELQAEQIEKMANELVSVRKQLNKLSNE
ncbi:hypothetical protein DSM03_1176 [Leeuwenhoekiella aestuarii]|uniref:hypothetical protein n=1 Tax=Leeuwenhoekiella aestuarii TaxID=2249426 RepID=UPI001025C71F|nr:hypothetical protein [Leeuwenhoekiella aestuarii]RXG11369.1 hypothetical protein DSM03_1176 [Leeuwenhoekiella aestuarii]